MTTILTIAYLILSIVAILDVAKSNRDVTSKAVLMILILLFPLVGPILYLLVFKDKGFA